MSREKINITIEDVKIAFKVINEFLNQVDEFERLASRLKRYAGRTSEKEMILKMFMESMGVKKPETVGEEAELTPEELERLKKIAEKYVK